MCILGLIWNKRKQSWQLCIVHCLCIQCYIDVANMVRALITTNAMHTQCVLLNLKCLTISKCVVLLPTDAVPILPLCAFMLMWWPCNDSKWWSVSFYQKPKNIWLHRIKYMYLCSICHSCSTNILTDCYHTKCVFIFHSQYH